MVYRLFYRCPSIFIIIVLILNSYSVLAVDRFNVVVGFSKPPYVIQENNSGFEIELVRNVLASMGKTTKFVYTAYERTPKMLAVKEIDAVMTTNNKTIPYQSKLSDVYINYQNVVISLKSKHLKINSIDDLAAFSVASFQNADKVLGEKFGNAVKKSPLFLQIKHQSQQPLLLLKGRIDVIVIDKNIFNYLVAEIGIQNPENIFSFYPIFPKSPYKMAFKDSANVQVFNQVLKQYLSSNSYLALLKKYHLTNSINPLYPNQPKMQP